jgi:phenylacetic acid degradation operon negative regulatory protein
MRPQSIIIDLLSPRGTKPISVTAIVESCALFGISSNLVRVTLARLVARGLLNKVGPAEYALSESAVPLNRHVLRWSLLEFAEKPWNGDWLMIHLERRPTGRDRAAARRAFRLARLAEATPTLIVRPDNIRPESHDAAGMLFDLKLGFRFFSSYARVEPGVSARWLLTLWPVEKLRAAHNETATQLDVSLTRLYRMPFEKALVESFLVGGEAIRALLFDPLLPEVVMPGRERRLVLDLMRLYDKAGRELWRRFNTRFEHSPKMDFAPFKSAPLSISAAAER